MSPGCLATAKTSCGSRSQVSVHKGLRHACAYYFSSQHLDFYSTSQFHLTFVSRFLPAPTPRKKRHKRTKSHFSLLKAWELHGVFTPWSISSEALEAARYYPAYLRHLWHLLPRCSATHRLPLFPAYCSMSLKHRVGKRVADVISP